MISMPVIFREFRVAARHKRTFVLRAVFGLLMAFVALMFVVSTAFSGMSSGSGYYLIKTLAWQMFVLLFVLAPAMASGCIADERKQGTLGLLFLTHLNSADIVLGKFVSHAVDLSLLFLSATPFLFVPVLMGGVNWDVAFGALLSILSILVLALAFGVFSSAISRTTAQAVIVAYVGLILYNVVMFIVPRIAEAMLGAVPGKLWLGGLMGWCKMASPVAAMYSGGSHEALVSLLWSGSVAAVLIGISVWKLPRTLHTETFREPLWRSARGLFAPSVRTIRKRPVRGSTINRHPLLWLYYGRYGNWVFQLVIVAVICVVLAWMYYFLRSDLGRGVFSFSLHTGGWIFGFAIYIVMLVSVARSFATEKEDGSLELLLITPVTNRQIVHARIGSVLLRFGLLYALGCGVQLVGKTMYPAGMFVAEIIGDVTSLLCLLTVGLLISVWAKSVTQSILLTIFATIILGWLLTMVGYMFIGVLYSLWIAKFGGSGTLGTTTSTMWFFGLGAMGPRAVIELIMAVLAYRLLIKNFRKYAAR